MNSANNNGRVVVLFSNEEMARELLIFISNFFKNSDIEVIIPKSKISSNSYESFEDGYSEHNENEHYIGIITQAKGCRSLSDLCVFHKEIKSMICLEKSRWLLAHANVVFAKRFLRDLGYDTPESRRVLSLKPGNRSIGDLCIIDMYETAICNNEELLEHRHGNWVHEYYKTSDAKGFLVAQFKHRFKLDDQYDTNIKPPPDIKQSNPASSNAAEKKANRPVIMVSSTVYGIENLLVRVYTLLTRCGYEVWMSHVGTIPVDSKKNAFNNCLDAVEKCDLFLGIITTSYGTGRKGSDRSITHDEILRAKSLKKPCFFLIQDNVVFAKNLLHDLNFETAEKRKELNLKLKKGAKSVTDLGVIDMYEDAIRCNDSQVVFKGYFYRFQEAEDFIVTNFEFPDKVMSEVKRFPVGAV